MADATTAPAPIVAAQWPLIYKTAREVFDRAKAFYWPDSEARQLLVLELINIYSSVREYAVASASDLADVWASLREHKELLDLVLAVTGDLYMELEVTHEQLSSSLAVNIHGILPTDVSEENEHLVTDNAFVESVGQIEELIQLFVNNRWFLTLAILKRAGALSLYRPLPKD